MFIAVGTIRYFQISARLKGQTPPDWGLFVVMADNFAAQPLHALASVRDLPTGPLMPPLLVPLHRLGSDGGWFGTGILLMSLSLVAVRMCELSAARWRGSDRDDIRITGLVGGGLLVAAWVGPSLWYGHPDDVFALFALIVAVLACMDERWVLVAVAVGLAAAFKPWGLYFIPLAMVRDPRRYRGLAIALAVGLAPWLPYWLADHHTLDAAHFIIRVTSDSSLRAFGVATHTKEHWSRPLQFILAIAAGAWAVRRGKWWLVVMLGFAIRINLEPAGFGYYAAGPMVGAFLADVVRPGRLPAARTVVVWCLLYGVGGLAADLRAGSTSLDVVQISARLAMLAVPLAELLRPNRVDESEPIASGPVVGPQAVR